MELAVSAIAGELVGRFISFLMSKYSKYSNHVCLEKKQLDRLQQLLLRAHMIVEEADGRYIANAGMLVQLKMLAEAMYRGYHVLDTFQYRHLKESVEEEVSDSSACFLTNPIKRFRPAVGIAICNSPDLDLQSALLDLEDIAANMKEFVILLGASERMLCRPYDTYLYIDNFMFSRHTEKQHVINILLQRNPLCSPTVVPITGDYLVGKKTLVAHVCNDERVRSYFSSILQFNGEDLHRIDHDKFASGRILIVVTFVSDVDDEDWTKFYLSLHKESKVVIICRIERLLRFGTMKPIRLSTLSHEEYSYLFKMLSFGSANPQDHPSLVLVADEFAKVLKGSFVAAYSTANVLRSNLNLQFWLCILNKCRIVIGNNFAMFGEHLILRLKRRSPVDFTSILPCSAAPLRLMPPRTETEVSKRKLPMLRFGDLLVYHTIRPKGDFDLVTWESRMPPYTKFIYFVPSSAEEKVLSPRRKHRGLRA